MFRAFGHCLGCVVFLSIPLLAWSTPPEYLSLKREQRADYAPNPQEVMRIWVAYVGQGDGILIQFPETCNYDPDPSDGLTDRTERVDVLVDGGSHSGANADNIANVVNTLYPVSQPKIEYTILTHHDKDHVLGLTRILDDGFIALERVYHNGLATYAGSAGRFFVNGTPGAFLAPILYKGTKANPTQIMARLDSDTKVLNPADYIDSYNDIDSRIHAFTSVYKPFANALIKSTEAGLTKLCERLHVGDTAIRHEPHRTNLANAGISIDVLWPQENLRAYGGATSWSHTINGNSVTFRLTYGDFAMLFTGDHNDRSEDAMLEHLQAIGREDLLECDVLKVPHHGSHEASEKFFTHPQMDPVISVASMGDIGFKSKHMLTQSGRPYKGAWQHPARKVIKWLGGHHRVYCTYVHEKVFRYEEITNETERMTVIEISHVLIETDGKWFRVVEVPTNTPDLEPPSMQSVKRSNGIRWVRATPGPG